MTTNILGIVGSYRKGGIIDSLVSETLASAEQHGAQTTKLYLIDKHIEFCTNCRKCTQQPGRERGTCVQNDDMAGILAEYDQCDALVFGAPVNFFNINAITRRFMERLVCYAYWPWEKPGPAIRSKSRGKKAVLITSSAMPALMGRIFTGAPRALKIIAGTMGAKPVASIYAGMVAMEEHRSAPEKARRRARKAGQRLALG